MKQLFCFHRLRQVGLSAGAALLLAACSGGAGPDLPITLGPAPVPSALRAEFSAADAPAPQASYGPFIAANLAQASLDHAGAAHYFVQALDRDPDSALLAERAFRGLLMAGRVAEAAELTSRRRDRDTAAQAISQNDLARLVEFVDLAAGENWQALLALLSKTERKDFLSLFSPIFEAWSRAALGQGDRALQTLRQILIHPQLKSLALEQEAYMLDYLGSPLAEAAYEEVIAEDSLTSLQPIIAYAGYLMQQRRVDKARALLQQQYSRFKNNDFLLREGSRVLAGVRPSRLAAIPNGALGLVLYRLGSEFSRGENREAAVIYLRLAVHLDPLAGDALTMLGSVFERAGDPGAASEAYAAVAPYSPLYRTAHLRRISALQTLERHDLAWELVSQDLRKTPADSRLLILAGDLQRAQGHYGRATGYYDTAIAGIGEPGPEDWFVFFARGVSLEQSGNWLAAEVDMRQALALQPDEPSVLNYLGYSWLDRGVHLDEAKEMILKAASARPEDGFIVDSLGWVFFLTGDYDKAVEHLELAVSLEPADPTINEHLGDAYWRTGRRREARFQWRRALVGAEGEGDRQQLRAKLDTGLTEVAALSTQNDQG